MNNYSGGTRIIENTRLVAGSDTALGAPNAPLVIQSGELVTAGPVTISRPVTIFSGSGIDSGGNSLALSGPVTLVTDSGNSSQLVFSGTAQVVGALSLVDGQLDVKPGAVLTGVRTISVPTVIEGTLSPGNSPGTLTFTAPAALTSTATYNVSIDGTGTGGGW